MYLQQHLGTVYCVSLYSPASLLAQVFHLHTMLVGVGWISKRARGIVCMDEICEAAVGTIQIICIFLLSSSG